MNNLIDSFEIWIELDEYDMAERESYKNDEFCNAAIIFSNGLHVSLNVWSEKFFYEKIKNLDWMNEQVAILPDIVVREFNASSIRKIITSLVEESKWLYGRGFPTDLSN